MSVFGLIGKQIDYSFSKAYFTDKFDADGLSHSYKNFDIDSIESLPRILETPGLKGLNVTIPYKEAVIPYLDHLDKRAKEIGAVNTIKIKDDGSLIGYNTDYYGFKKSIEPLLNPNHKRALILGTGGASKAIAYALSKMGITYQYVSRTTSEMTDITYDTITENLVAQHRLIINCTPLGTHPQTNACPPIPYDAITDSHFLYDLIYNPEETKFLTIGKLKGAKISNGLEMLEQQADRSWELWN
jgi:shikimate dehydrogenase